jgi:uncharacterized protein (DUF1330 family)
MAAFLVGTIRINDAALWRQYVERVGATFVQYEGEVLGRGVKAVELSGHAHGELLVVARFNDLAALRRWHESPEYQALLPVRMAAADVVLTAYEE